MHGSSPVQWTRDKLHSDWNLWGSEHSEMSYADEVASDTVELAVHTLARIGQVVD